MRRTALALCLMALLGSVGCSDKYDEREQRSYDLGYEYGQEVVNTLDVSGQTPRQVRDFCADAVRGRNPYSWPIWTFGCQDAINASLGQESYYKTIGNEG